jgi:hypothetical protein
MNKTSLFLSCIGGLVMTTNPWMGAAYMGASYVNYVIDKNRKKKTDQACHKLMETMIKDNHPGLRRIVGDQEMDRAIQLTK